MNYSIESKRKRASATNQSKSKDNKYLKIKSANSISTNDDDDDLESCEEMFEYDQDENSEEDQSTECSSSVISDLDSKSKSAKTRRKQVKPLRISHQAKQKQTKNHEQTLTKESNEKTLKLSCGFCSDNQEDPIVHFPTLNDLKNHLYKDHIEQILSGLVTPQTPSSSSSSNTGSSKSNRSMESFCTICKKEVCNKYFLKSHLLNKHGVQLDDYLAAQNSPSSTQAQPSSQAALVAAAAANELIENHAQSLNMHTLGQVVASKYLQNSSSSSFMFMSSQLNKLNSTSNSNKYTADEDDQAEYEDETGEIEDQSDKIQMDSNAALFSHYLNLALQQQNTQAVSSTEIFNDQLKLNQSQSSSCSTGDFCDICQKQFCNKYYLKKHKLDVHGHQMDAFPIQQQAVNLAAQNEQNKSLTKQQSTSQLAQSNLTNTLSMLMNPFIMQLTNQHASPPVSSSSSSIASSSSFSAPKPQIIDAVDEKEEDKIVEETAEAELNNVKSKSKEMKCDQCTKVFYSREYLNLHKLNRHDSSNARACQNNKENNSNKSPQSQQSNILTNESFCEYCNKSFCNKYFLRTHMSKAHGKTLIIENNTNNTMINSLINKNNSDLEDEPDEDTSLNNINLNETYFASKIVDRVQCDICNKQVCNKYFLRTHKQKVHGIYDSVCSSSAQRPLSDDEFDENYDEGEVYQDDEKELGEMTTSINGIQKRRSSICSVISSTNLSLLSASTSSAKKESTPPPESPSSINNAVLSSGLSLLDTQNSFCSLCKRKFYSYNFLRNHMNKIHSVKLPKRTTDGTLENEANDANNVKVEDVKQIENEAEVEVEIEKKGEEKPVLENDYKKYSSLPLTKLKSKLKNKNKNKKMSANFSVLSDLNALSLLSAPNSTASSLSSLLSLINELKIECRICYKEFSSKQLLKQHVLNTHKIKFSEYLSRNSSLNNSKIAKKFKKSKLKMFKYANKKQRNDEINQNEIENEIINEKSFEQHNQNRKRKSSTESLETSSSKKSRTSSTSSDCQSQTNELNQLMKHYKSLYSSNGNNESSQDPGSSNLQAFMLEKDDSSENGLNSCLMPCLIYLPVKSKVINPISLKIKLKPVTDVNMKQQELEIANEIKPTGALLNLHLQLQEKLKN